MRYFLIGLIICILPTSIFCLDSIAPSIKGFRFPNISPDGNTIAFAYHGDIWTVSAKGGEAKQITFDNSHDTKPVWSPDGKWLAFSSNRTGNYDVWVIPAIGGDSRQITFDSSWDAASDWSADGKKIIFSSYRGGEPNVWSIPFATGLAEKISLQSGRDGVLTQDILFFCSGSSSLWQKGYEGASNWDLYKQDITKGTLEQITDHSGTDIKPVTSSNNMMYYLSEREVISEGKKNRVYNLIEYNIDNANHNLITNLPNDIYSLDISQDGSFAVIEMDFLLWTLPLTQSSPELIPISITREKTTATENRTITSGGEMGHWSNDASQITFILDSNVFIMDSTGTNLKQITNDTKKKEWPRFSPNSKTIAYCGYEKGKSDIFIVDIASGDTKQLTSHESNDFYHSWSPDGKTILFTSERSGNRDIWSVSVSGGSPRQITYGKESEDDAVYSPDGNWIAFDSGESGNQEIWVMPAGGTYDDAKQVTEHKSLTQVPTWSKDSNLIAYETSNGNGTSSIRVISRNGGDNMLLDSNGSTPCWSPNGDFILFESNKEGSKSFYYLVAPQQIQKSRKISFVFQKTVSKTEEQGKVFDEAWEYINNNFYDKDFHGKDWENLGKKYRPFAVDAADNEEMNLYINRMLGELEASHLGISTSQENTVETGYLGWELEQVPGQKGLRVSKIVKDGPADKAWVREGDYVFQIEGELISPKINFAKILNNKINHRVQVYVSPKYSIEDGRYVEIIPTSLAKVLNLKYTEILTKRVMMVRDKCKGEVLYLHLRDMGEGTLQEFRRVMARYTNQGKGMILDLRDNVGGFIHQELLTILAQKPYMTTKAKNGDFSFQPQYSWGKPIVVIINQDSFSDAEVFTQAFKELKLGYVVGVATSGGVIGTRDIRLSNGSTFRVPTLGYYSLEGKNLEGLGVTPDYTVAETFEDKKNGKDPQLELAINLILQEIKGNK